MTVSRLTARIESWPIAGGFTISRGTKTEAVVVVAEIAVGAAIGRGECVPYARYGESVEEVHQMVEAMAEPVADGITRADLLEAMPAGAARNAIDCAMWDLEAKRTGRRAAETAGIGALSPVVTAYTLSLGTPESMADAARRAAERPLIKVKLGGDGDAERIAAVREGAPNARLIVDANEAWAGRLLERLLEACAKAGVELVEQPLPATDDEALAAVDRPVPVCADESVHDGASLLALSGRYDAINIKLDKTGGLTEALALAEEAKAAGFRIMVGCMLATSLAMAPALLVAQRAEWVDLDGPLLLARDREPGLAINGSVIQPPAPELWG